MAFIAFSELGRRLKDALDEKAEAGLPLRSTGVESLDRLLGGGLWAADVCLVDAPTAAESTRFAQAVAVGAARRKRDVAVISLRMGAAAWFDWLVRETAAQFVAAVEAERMRIALQTLAQLPVRVFDHRAAAGGYFLDSLTTAFTGGLPQLLVVDGLHLLEPEAGLGAAAAIEHLAAECMIPLIGLTAATDDLGEQGVQRRELKARVPIVVEVLADPVWICAEEGRLARVVRHPRQEPRTVAWPRCHASSVQTP